MNTLHLFAAAWWAPLADEAVKLLAGVLMVVLTALAAKGLNKLGIDTTSSKNGLVNDLIRQAIGSSEEWAHRQVAVMNAKAPPSGDEKLSKAVEIAMRLLQENNVEAKSQAWVEARIHAALGLNRVKTLKLEGVATSLKPPPA